jgi:hypothetical protein
MDEVQCPESKQELNQTNNTKILSSQGRKASLLEVMSEIHIGLQEVEGAPAILINHTIYLIVH